MELILCVLNDKKTKHFLCPLFVRLSGLNNINNTAKTGEDVNQKRITYFGTVIPALVNPLTMMLGLFLRHHDQLAFFLKNSSR